jgi:HD-like signal output (HDOD) protein
MAAEIQTTAFEFVKALAAELSEGTIELPAFPQIAERVRRVLEDPANTPARTAQVISTEGALAAKIVAMSNSAAFTCAGKPVTELRTAVSRLGDHLVHSTALAFALAQLRREPTFKAIEPEMRRLSAEGMRVAAFCYVLARHAELSADEAFLTGLLHGVGKLYIYSRALGHPELFRDPGSLQEIVHGWHAQIGKAILESWTFPERILEAVAAQDEIERRHYGQPDLTDVLIGAAVLAGGMQKAEAVQVISQIPALQRLKLDTERAGALMDEAEHKVSELHAVLGS